MTSASDARSDDKLRSFYYAKANAVLEHARQQGWEQIARMYDVPEMARSMHAPRLHTIDMAIEFYAARVRAEKGGL